MASGVNSDLQSSLHISIAQLVMVGVERLLCSTSAGRIGKPSQLLRVVHPLLSKLGYFMQRSW